jgi:hypothetical protein
VANELTISASLALLDSEDADTKLEKCNSLADITTKKYNRAKHNVGITEEAMYLGEVTSLGWACIVNRDATNFVELRTGTGGTKVIKIPAGKGVVFHFGTGITAPYLIATPPPARWNT